MECAAGPWGGPESFSIEVWFARWPMSDSGPDSVIRLCRLDVRFEPDMSVIDVAVRPEVSRTVPLLSLVADAGGPASAILTASRPS